MQHVIKKQIIDLLVDKQLDSFRIQQQISDHFWQYLVPLLENEFDKISAEDEVICLDRIEIDLGIIHETEINKAGWDGNLIEAVEKQVKDLILQEIASGAQPFVKLSSAANSYRQWFFYMRNGYLPWNAIIVDKEWYDQVMEELATNYNSVTELRKEIISNPITVMRMIRQHSPVFLIRLVEILTAEKQTDLFIALTKIRDKLIDLSTFDAELKPMGKIEQRISSLNLIHENIWKQVLELSSETSGGVPSWLPEVMMQVQIVLSSSLVDNNITPNADQQQESVQDSRPSIRDVLKNSIDKNVTQIENKVLTQVITDEGVFTQNAGLLLIHPFLNSLFNRVGLLAGKQFVSIESQDKAIYLLHYVATGRTKAEEYELVLPKILCGYPMNLAVSTGIKLSGKELEEADDMLEAAIASWDILKSTSPEGLREGFLQRSGKVLVQNEKISIQVEKSAIDVLLDHLPWNLSIIKLPWLDEILKVEWR